MLSSSTYTFCLLLLPLFSKKIVFCKIDGPTRLQGLVGNDVIFKWNTTDGREIRSAVWGLGSGQIPDPQFINVNTKNGKTISPSLPKPYTGRVDFVGNLSQGHAWFVIKNLTRNDTTEYVARISDGDVSELQPYSVEMSVKDRPVLVLKPTSSTAIVTVSSNHTNNTMNASSQTPRPPSSEATSITPHLLFTMSLVLTGQLIWLKGHLNENAPIFESPNN